MRLGRSLINPNIGSLVMVSIGLYLIAIIAALIVLKLGVGARVTLDLKSYNYPYETMVYSQIIVVMGRGEYSLHITSVASAQLGVSCLESEGGVNESILAGRESSLRISCEKGLVAYYKARVSPRVVDLGSVEVSKGWP